MNASEITLPPVHRTISEIIIHCSATPEGRDVSAADIRLWHMRDRGFADIGYHYIVRLNGSIEPGRPLQKAGAHCLGHNSRSIGICYIGGLDTSGYPADTRTPQQRHSLRNLILRLKQTFPHAGIHGHRDFATKACPCFDATAEYASIP